MRQRACAIIIKDKKLLLVTGHNFGKYWAPGGGVDAGETYEQALKRELYEELKVELISSKFYAEYTKTNDKTKEMQHAKYYLVEVKGTPVESEEISHLAWVSKNPEVNISQTLKEKIIDKLASENLL